MIPLVKILRVHQYSKNLFVFLPIFFGLRIFNAHELWLVLLAFCAFSLTASAIYIFNDLHDRDEDRRHPQKRKRPIAAGAIPVGQATAVLLFCLVAGLGIAVWLSFAAFLFLLGYGALNVAYSLKLKHIAIVDIATIAVGFVLRLYVGSVVTAVPLSMWIISMTFLLALFLAVAKRRDDVIIFLQTGAKTRTVVDGYNLEFVNAAMVVMASVVIVFYAMYTVSADVVARIGSERLFLTMGFVVVGILRYMQITFVENGSGSPTQVLLRDRFIQGALAGWFATFFWILYA